MNGASRRRVLIAVDLDGASEELLREGLRLARALAAEPMLIYAYAFPAPSPAGFYPRASVAIFQQAVADLRRIAHSFEPSLRDDQLLARSGPPAGSIVAAAQEFASILIVMGTRRLHRVERMLVESNAAEVTRHAPCPVLVIPRRSASAMDAR